MRLGALLFGAAAWLAVVHARAQECHPPVPSKWSNVRVERLYEQGRERLAEATRSVGDARQQAAASALQAFREVESQVSCLPPNLIALAQTLELQEQHLAAQAIYRRLLDARPELLRSGGEFWKEWIAEAEQGLARTMLHSGVLTLRLGAHGCAKGLPLVFIDDEQQHYDDPKRLDPGQYVVRARAAGCEPFEQRATVVAGATATVDVEWKTSAPARVATPRKCSLLGIPCWAAYSAGAAIVLGASIGTYAALRPSSAPTPAPITNCTPKAPSNFGCATLD